MRQVGIVFGYAVNSDQPFAGLRRRSADARTHARWFPCDPARGGRRSWRGVPPSTPAQLAVACQRSGVRYTDTDHRQDRSPAGGTRPYRLQYTIGSTNDRRRCRNTLVACYPHRGCGRATRCSAWHGFFPDQATDTIAVGREPCVISLEVSVAASVSPT